MTRRGASLRCPNCRAVNPPQAIVCGACGINLPRAVAASTRVEDDVAPAVEATWDQSADSADAEVAAWTGSTDGAIDAADVGGIGARSRRVLARQLRWVVIGAVALAVAILAISAWRAEEAARERAALVQLDARAQACLARGDAACARDAFGSIVAQDPTYPGARDGLESARRVYAEQLAQSGQFSQAVDELDAILRDDPGDRAASEQLRRAFDRWYDDAIGRGDVTTAFFVDRLRRARFPTTPTPALNGTI